MTLLDYYIERNIDQDWYLDHYSTGQGAHGKIFAYIGTIFRSTLSFKSQFKKFLEIENIPRERWPSPTGQERDKQRTVNMVESKLFIKKESNIYVRSSKGMLYNRFVEGTWNQDEDWLINYLFLIDSYFDKITNYPITRSKEILDILSAVFGEEVISERLTQFLKLSQEGASLQALVRTDFFVMHSFFSDVDFLTKFNTSSDLDKASLFDYIVNNLNQHNRKCFISHKYENGGNYTKNTLLDDARVLFMSLYISNIDAQGLEEFTQNVVVRYLTMYPIEKNKVIEYVISNKEIFEPIYINILGLEDIEDYKEDTLFVPATEAIQDTPNTKIDDTDTEGKHKRRKQYMILKKVAKESEGYKCALDQLNNCKYFTSKKTNKKYLEIHHLIPREFGNDFEYSIEVVANYVPLCPRCHSLLHKAKDEERISSLNYLYNSRNERLLNSGIQVEAETVNQYYRLFI